MRVVVVVAAAAAATTAVVPGADDPAQRHGCLPHTTDMRGVKFHLKDFLGLLMDKKNQAKISNRSLPARYHGLGTILQHITRSRLLSNTFSRMV